MQYEWRKIFSGKNKLLIAMVLAVNLFLLVLQVYGSGTDVPPEIYRSIFRDMEGMTNQEKYEYLKENSEAEIESGSLSDYEKRSVMEEMTEYAETMTNYEAYLSGMEESLGKKIGISLFGGKNSFAQRNAKKMQREYGTLHGTVVEFEPYKGIEMADATVTNILVVFLVVFLSAECLISENEEGILILLRSCKKGRGWMLKNRIYTLSAGSLLIAGLFLLENLLFGAITYGVGNLGRPLQSLPGYEGCLLKMSVFGFLWMLWIVRAFALMLISAFVLVLTVYTYQIVNVLGCCILTGSVSYLLYVQSGLQSGAAMLHYVNPVALTKAAPLLKGEMNLNIVGFPFSPIIVAAGVGIVTYAALNLWLFWRFGRNQEAGKIRLAERKRTKKKVYSPTIQSGEVYKLLVTRKGVLLLVGVLAIQIFLYPGRRYVASPNEIYENYCMQELEGEIGEKQEQWLMKEQDRLNCAEERDLFQLEREVMENKILPLSEHLKSMKQEKGEARFIQQTGYEKLFGADDHKTDRKNTMLYVMVLLCTVSAYISMEKTGNMLALIRPTKAGWRRVKNWKMLIVVSFSMVCMLVVWIPDWIWIWKSYEVTEWNAVLSWLFAFRDARIDITTGWYFAILIILRLFGGAMVGLLMLLVSEKVEVGWRLTESMRWYFSFRLCLLCWAFLMWNNLRFHFF